jgi:hypothetical protein
MAVALTPTLAATLRMLTFSSPPLPAHRSELKPVPTLDVSFQLLR